MTLRDALLRTGSTAVGLAVLLGPVACSGGGDDEPRGAPDAPPPPVTVVPAGGGPARVVVGALPPRQRTAEVPARARFVAPDGDDGADGSRRRPWRTVARAVQEAPDNATIVLRAGVYRESVEVSGKQLTLQAHPGEEVWLDGSRDLTGFVADGPGRWALDGWTASFERLGADSHLLDPGRPLAGWPDQVFVDGAPLAQVASLEALAPGSFFVDQERSRLYIGSDPAGHTVAASVLEWALYLNGADGSRILGIGVRRYATPSALVGAIRVHCDDALVLDVTAEDNAYAGLSVMGRDVTVRQVTARRNGQLGVQARFADGLRLGRSLLEGNNTEGFDPGQQAGGAKLTASRGLWLEDNLVRGNAGVGLWLDQSVLGVSVLRNRVLDNLASGIMVELSAEALVAGNLAAGNGRHGLYVLESSDVRAWNNTLVQNGGRDVWVVEGERDGTDPDSADLDRRHGTDPRIPFDVQRVALRNNVIADDPGATGRSRALLGVDDVGGRSSAEAMEVTSDHNGFWRRAPDSTDAFSTWAAYPDPVLVSVTMAEHRAATGQDAASRYREGGRRRFLTGTGEDTRPAEAGWHLDGGAEPPEEVRRALDLGADDHPVGVPPTVRLLVAANAG